MSSVGRPETRTQILEAARAMFEELGYHGAGLGAIATRAGVSRQAIYLHFASKAELLTALHLHIFTTDVLPVLDRHPITAAKTALDALDATIAADVEVSSRVWRIHEALTTARRQHPEVEETLRPGEEDRYGVLLAVAQRLKQEGALPPKMRASAFADMLWGLTGLGTYRSLVIERGWSLDQYRRWVRTTIRLHLNAD
ncbi:TetR/AcrR family transcriptional regulator [Nocardioides albidus]|uniref:TetR/AcrR family transcriptional regulator n=1 Tax=Nocardioides albidus TaxID=1517589 RepID=A0A5C4VWG0_9ACTN|nr:TetR/AcrR family transcriptional regulator [Nocardioides albidus]TNM39776.1 TetR/AcrR family transcriptional regulator [Nocardioides albidus]